MKRFLAFPVLIAALAIASFANITVTAPANGVTVQSPVTFVASATSRYEITGMAILVDSKQVYSTTKASLDTSIAMTSGTHAVVVEATNSEGRVYSDSLTLVVKAATSTPPAALHLTCSPPANGTVGSRYLATLDAAGGTAPYKWSIASGSLPAGLTLSSSGTISGTPTTAVASSFSITAKDSESTPQSATGKLTITVIKGSGGVTPPPATLTLTTSTLANGTVGSSYSAALQATGGTAPYTWSVASGTLPAGLTLSSSGTISGTPTTAVASSFSVTVKDSESTPQTATGSLALTIIKGSGGVTPPPVSTCTGTCYYVSPTGSDNNAGTSSTAPWQTIAKVQSFQSSLNAGDSVLFQMGGVWSGQLDITDMNGKEGSPITIGSYGTGAKPVIDGGQTSSSNGNSYCIDAVSGTFTWITINGIECRNAYKQGITFQAYNGTGTNGSGIVVQNSYIHNTGAGACTTCGSQPASDPGGYLNQLDAQQTNGIQFLNNTVDHCGGHNCIQVHYDVGSPVISGNIVGTTSPWCNHNCIDVKGGADVTVSNNTVSCSGCASTVSAFYTEYNGFSGVGGGSSVTNEHITYTGNVTYLVPMAFHSDSGGSCTTSSCSLHADYYNNTVYAGSNSGFTQFLHSTCPSGSEINIEKNIVDGGQNSFDGACSPIVTWNYNDDGGVYPTSLNGSAGPNDLSNVNPEYVSVSGMNFTAQNSTILTSGKNDTVTSYAYLGAQ